MPRSPRSRKPRSRRPSSGGGWLRRTLRAGGWTLLGLLLAGAGVGALYVHDLDREIRERFEGQRWALPARVYARPLELYPGQRLDRERLVTELEALNYRRGQQAGRAGEYAVNGNTVELTTRPFTFGDGPEPAHSVRVELSGGYVRSVVDRDSGTAVDLMRVEPLLIGSIYPTHGEDRVVVDLDDVPHELIGAVMAIEDRRFLSHRGVDPIGIARAAWANLRAGRTVQGGSTLTQQLVKNFYLTQDQTLSRKLNEAVMALILEHRYSKEAILEAYLNEVFLGQAGERSIHGFGQAARFYYQRPLDELRLDQLALLVGLARGASYYDPRRHPERALARRDRVLDAMHATGLVDTATVETARGMPLDVSPAMAGGSRFPAFLDLVRRELRTEYAEEDLRSEGLRIFTSLDPGIQLAVEDRVREEVDAVAPRAGEHADDLQAAAVVTDARSGEVLALVGGRDPGFPGFNRAVEAQRPVGSLIKPFVFLAALTNPQRYTLASPLEDSPVTLQLAHGEPWTPRNFDREHRGEVTAWEALVHSYNVPAVRLADRIGISQLVDVLQTFGLQRTPEPNPSLALGALDLSPLQVAELYQGLASGGYATGTRAIRDVLDTHDEVLSHYGLELRGAVPDGAAHLLTEALHDVTVDGTGRVIGERLPGRRLAGKTGTTNEFRDAWFAGYDDRHVGVVWLGLDDNRTTGLTGGSGAAPVWAGIMGELPGGSIAPLNHPSIEFHEIDLETGARIVDEDHACERARRLPFWQNSAPEAVAECEGEAEGDDAGWFGRMFRGRD